MVSRRTFVFGGAGLGAIAVAGGAGAVLVEEDVLPGKVRFDKAIGRCRTLPPAPATAGVVRSQTFRSRHRRTDVTAAVVLPAGVRSPRGLPVAVALHGNGGTGMATARDLRLDRYLTEAVRTRRTPPFALVAVDGGPSSYWHRRANGEDPIAMITDELLPLLGRQGARIDRFGVIGWSMGGYGALVVAETVGAPRVAATVASSPALFASYADARRTNHQAFDGPEDFARSDVLAGLGRMKGVPAWVDCGTSDPFAAMARRLRSRLRPAGEMGRGCHDGAFWLRRLPAQLAFLGGHLAGT
ncbi:MAG: alpha/beta hydrolase [Actinoallomurus sp.]